MKNFEDVLKKELDYIVFRINEADDFIKQFRNDPKMEISRKDMQFNFNEIDNSLSKIKHIVYEQTERINLLFEDYISASYAHLDKNDNINCLSDVAVIRYGNYKHCYCPNCGRELEIVDLIHRDEIDCEYCDTHIVLVEAGTTVNGMVLI